MTKDMTEGAIPHLLVGFTIPLVLGNLFQLLYNAVDSMIVGKFVGETALAAVGTSSPLMTLAILFISGMCMGAGVLMGMHYGAKDYDVLERQISSTMIGGLMFSVLLSAVCVFLTPWMLRLIRTQEEVLPIATGYLRIIFCGLIFYVYLQLLCEHIAGTWRQQIAALFSDDQRCTQCGGRPVFRGGARLGQQRMCLFDGAKRGTLLSAVRAIY